MNRRAALAVLMALATCSPLPAATIFAQALADARAGGIDFNREGGEGFASAQVNSSSSNSAGLSMNASAAAQVTGLKHVGARATAFGHGPAGGGGGSAWSDARASIHDSFSLVATDPFGQPLANFPHGGGVFTSIIQMSGTVVASGGIPSSAAANALLGWRVSLAGQTSDGGFQHNTHDGTVSGQAPAPIVITVPWILGQTINVEMSATVNTLVAKASINASVFADAQFFNSIIWGGIVEVRDQQGNPIEHFTAIGSDGTTDWATAFVPEPGGLSLAVAATLILLSWGGNGARKR